MGKQAGMDIGMKEVAVMNQIVKEIGPLVSEDEVKLISMMTGGDVQEEDITTSDTYEAPPPGKNIVCVTQCSTRNFSLSKCAELPNLQFWRL